MGHESPSATFRYYMPRRQVGWCWTLVSEQADVCNSLAVEGGKTLHTSRLVKNNKLMRETRALVLYCCRISQMLLLVSH